MADPNRLIITKDPGAFEVKVFDAAGVAHDLTSHFQHIAGTTSPSAFSNEMKLKSDGTEFVVRFSAIGKRLIYTLDPNVIKQLVLMTEE